MSEIPQYPGQRPKLPNQSGEPRPHEQRSIDWLELAAAKHLVGGSSTTLRFTKNQTICRCYTPTTSGAGHHPLLNAGADIELHSGHIDVWLECGAPDSQSTDLQHLTTLGPGNHSKTLPELAKAVAPRGATRASPLRITAHDACCMTITSAPMAMCERGPRRLISEVPEQPQKSQKHASVSTVLDTLAERLPNTVERMIVEKTGIQTAARSFESVDAFYAALESAEIRVDFVPVCAASNNKITGYAIRPCWQDHAFSVLDTIRHHADSVDEQSLAALTEQLFDRACVWLRQKLGKDGFVCLPLSAAQLEVPHAGDHILNTLRRHGVSAQRVWIDLDETEFPVTDCARARAVGHLRRHGLRFVVSDFGRELAPLSALYGGHADAVKLNAGWLDDREPMATALRCVVDVCIANHVVIVGDCDGSGYRATMAAELGCNYLQNWNQDSLPEFSAKPNRTLRRAKTV